MARVRYSWVRLPDGGSSNGPDHVFGLLLVPLRAAARDTAIQSYSTCHFSGPGISIPARLDHSWLSVLRMTLNEPSVSSTTA